MAPSLEQIADRLTIKYNASRSGHGRSYQVWLKLRDARKRAIAAKPRRSKSNTDLPLFDRGK